MEKKKCSKCKKNKKLEEFNKNSKNKKTGLSAYCKECIGNISKNYYSDNKEKYKSIHKRNKEKSREWFNDYKKTLKCSRCPEKHPSCLEFHHLDPKQKDLNVSNMIRKFNKEDVLKEIEKCIVLCSNCHRKEHYKNWRCG